LYFDGFGQAIVTGELDLDSAPPPTVPKTPGLPKWRLKRAVAYIEAHLGEAITLHDLAASAGLTRMHFAAQFRAATGFRPHEYLLRRRIEHAQHLLLTSPASLADIALLVGFQTQPHFTNVFRRFAGQPPCRWRRQAHRDHRQR
jgi:transcriptional regulator GlxA family with amidase domain